MENHIQQKAFLFIFPLYMQCIRVAGKETRRLLIAGIIDHPNMERFLRDSYANYVIQTCLDCADEDQRIKFVECIRPLLSSIRNTPYGKRIYSKIHRDINNGNINGNVRSTSSSSSTARHLQHHHQRGMIDNTTTTSIINGMNSLSLNTMSASTSSSTNTTTSNTNTVQHQHQTLTNNGSNDNNSNSAAGGAAAAIVYM